MNAKQRKQDKRVQKFVKLGIRAESTIQQAARQEAEWSSKLEEIKNEAERTKGTLARAMANASSFSSAMQAAERDIELRLKAKDQEHAKNIQFVEDQHHLDMAMTTAQHQADMLIAEDKLKEEQARSARYKRDWEEPNKLRRRLATKEQENNELRGELSRMKTKLAAYIRGGAPVEEPYHSAEVVA